MIEEGYKDMRELVIKEKYKELNSIEDQNMIITDYICLFAIRMMANHKEKETYKRSSRLLTILLGEDNKRESISLGGEIKDLVELFYEQKKELDEIVNNLDSQQDKYRENLFSQEDFLFYRGIAQFYMNNYKTAIKDFEDSAIAKKIAHNQFNVDSKADQSATSRGSAGTDLSDIGLCAVNVNEYLFNTILSLIMVSFSINKID